MKLSILVFAYVLAVVVTASEDPVKETFQCVDGIDYVENECNKCRCNRGILICTRKMCPDRDQLLINCEAGAVWQEDCKRCWCAKNVGTVCTSECHHHH